MKYTEVTLKIEPVEPFRDLLIDTLGNEGPYDSFVETPDGMKAYIPTDQFDPDWLKGQLAQYADSARSPSPTKRCPTRTGTRNGRNSTNPCWWNAPTGIKYGYAPLSTNTVTTWTTR